MKWGVEQSSGQEIKKCYECGKTSHLLKDCY